jgi:hypothetical protein
MLVTQEIVAQQWVRQERLQNGIQKACLPQIEQSSATFFVLSTLYEKFYYSVHLP